MGLAGNNIKANILQVINQYCRVNHIFQKCIPVAAAFVHIKNAKYTAPIAKIDITFSHLEIISAILGKKRETRGRMVDQFAQAVAAEAHTGIIVVDIYSSLMKPVKNSVPNNVDSDFFQYPASVLINLSYLLWCKLTKKRPIFFHVDQPLLSSLTHFINCHQDIIRFGVYLMLCKDPFCFHVTAFVQVC